MTPRTGLLSIAAALLAALPAVGASHPDEALRIGWSALRPAAQSGGVLLSLETSDFGRELSSELGGRTVEITGFLLPSDLEGALVHEFMLVPMAGACSHSRQPPPNQVVRVTPEQPFEAEKIYQVVTVKGTLEASFDKAQLFILDGVRVVESGYRIGSATVASGGQEPPPAASSSPWKFLKQP
jgi:uncharacterized protein